MGDQERAATETPEYVLRETHHYGLCPCGREIVTPVHTPFTCACGRRHDPPVIDVAALLGRIDELERRVQRLEKKDKAVSQAMRRAGS